MTRCMCGALDCPDCGPAQGVNVIRTPRGYVADFDLEEVSEDFTAEDASDYFNSASAEEWDELMGMVARAVKGEEIAELIGQKVIDLVKKHIAEEKGE